MKDRIEEFIKTGNYPAFSMFVDRLITGTPDEKRNKVEEAIAAIGDHKHLQYTKKILEDKLNK